MVYVVDALSEAFGGYESSYDCSGIDPGTMNTYGVLSGKCAY